MPTVFYLTHPQVLIDPAIPVPHWGLSPIGRARAEAAASAPWTQKVCRIVSSTEVKAVETAAIFADARGLSVEPCADMHENDRSATGFLPPLDFEATADAFFAHPDISIRGWERAIDAQTRIVSVVFTVLSQPSVGDTLIVGHGAVGTLLMTHLLKVPISRTLDQPAGGGHVFAFDAKTHAVIHQWRDLQSLH